MMMTPQVDGASSFASSRSLNENRHNQKRRFSLKPWTMLMTLALGCTPSFSQTATASTPTQPQPTHIDVKEVKSSKGITAWIVEAHEIPVISLAIAFKNAGTAEDPKDLNGLVLLLSSMLDEGAGDWDSQEFKKLLLEKNIELSVSTSSDIFQVSFRTTRKNIAEAFYILKTILTKPRFDPDTLARVKNQVLTSLEQSLHNEHTIATNKLHSLIYENHPYGNTVEETLKRFPKITPEQMRQFIKDRFARDQLLITAVGDIAVDELKDYLDKTFGDFPEKATPSTVKDATLHNLGATVIERLNIPQSLIYFVQPGICRNHPDFYATFIMTKILGDGQFESRLWNEVREKRGLAYGIDADLQWSQHSSLFFGGTATKNNSTKEVVEIIRKVWVDMIKGATQAELDFVKKRMIGSFALNFSSTIRIAKALLIYQIDNLGVDYINKRNKIVSDLSLADVNKAAKSLLKPDQLTFIIVGEPTGLSSNLPTQEKKPGANNK